MSLGAPLATEELAERFPTLPFTFAGTPKARGRSREYHHLHARAVRDGLARTWGRDQGEDRRQGGVKISVISVGAKKARGRSSSHKIKLTLNPVDADGNPARVAATGKASIPDS